nr:type II toxin-antitoxin system RelE/ParE family toxin [Acidiferrobacter sp.]
MMWTVMLYDAFDAELNEMPETVQGEVLALMGLLKQFGPTLGRPHADTLKGSRHTNMKELRFKAADGVWRVACRLRV